MDTCLYDFLKLCTAAFPGSKKVIIVIETSRKETELEELKDTIQRTRSELRRILASKSNNELLEVQNTLQAANSKMNDYNITVNPKKHIKITCGNTPTEEEDSHRV